LSPVNLRLQTARGTSFFFALNNSLKIQDNMKRI
jgi:hypothetical protein